MSPGLLFTTFLFTNSIEQFLVTMAEQELSVVISPSYFWKHLWLSIEMFDSTKQSTRPGIYKEKSTLLAPKDTSALTMGLMTDRYILGFIHSSVHSTNLCMDGVGLLFSPTELALTTSLTQWKPPWLSTTTMPLPSYTRVPKCCGRGGQRPRKLFHGLRKI